MLAERAEKLSPKGGMILQVKVKAVAYLESQRLGLLSLGLRQLVRPSLALRPWLALLEQLQSRQQVRQAWLRPQLERLIVSPR